MSFVIAIAGHTGAGKTTALNYLSTACAGETVYLGAVVIEEVKRRMLPECAESERTVRLELRAEKGPAAFALMKAGHIVERVRIGTPVLVDAIFHEQEFAVIREAVKPAPAVLLAIVAPFGTRCKRLMTREVRPFTEEEVRRRDRTEIEQLGVERVFAMASRTIVNDGPVAIFNQALSDFLGERPWGNL